MTAKVHQNYINGQWLDGYDVIDNVNPSDISDIVGQYAKANADHCAKAVAAANAAFSSWSQSALGCVKPFWI